MACGCREHIRKEGGMAPEKTAGRPTPTAQCLFCAQKHADEALAAIREYTYEVENRSFVHGALRSIVLHTYKDYKDIASKAREAALLWQDRKWEEAEKALLEAVRMIYARTDAEG